MTNSNLHKNVLKNSRKLDITKFIEIYGSFSQEEQHMIIDSKLLSLRACTLKLLRVEQSLDENSNYIDLLKINNRLLEIRNIRKRLMKMRYDITLVENND